MSMYELEVDPETHVCANCTFWKGPRRTADSGRKVSVESNKTGKCVFKKSPWFDQVQLAMSTCNTWIKWAMLK